MIRVDIIKTLIIRVLKWLNLYSLYCLRKGGALKNAGWFNSFRSGIPLDGDGNPIPWLTYSAIRFIEKRIRSEMSVFEYSCGNSTLWWSKRVKRLVSCEHNKEWYEKILKLIPSNIELYQIDLEYGGDYSQKISEYNQTFDIIVIDGRDRVNCVKNCLNALKEDGVIIWDNSERDYYEEGFIFLLANGYKRIDFEGMGPVNVDSWRTSIFYKDKNCFGI